MSSLLQSNHKDVSAILLFILSLYIGNADFAVIEEYDILNLNVVEFGRDPSTFWATHRFHLQLLPNYTALHSTKSYLS
jgi:hypothetical protein